MLDQEEQIHRLQEIAVLNMMQWHGQKTWKALGFCCFATVTGLSISQ